MAREAAFLEGLAGTFDRPDMTSWPEMYVTSSPMYIIVLLGVKLKFTAYLGAKLMKASNLCSSLRSSSLSCSIVLACCVVMAWPLK